MLICELQEVGGAEGEMGYDFGTQTTVGELRLR